MAHLVLVVQEGDAPWWIMLWFNTLPAQIAAVITLRAAPFAPANAWTPREDAAAAALVLSLAPDDQDDNPRVPGAPSDSDRRAIVATSELPIDDAAPGHEKVLMDWALRMWARIDDPWDEEKYADAISVLVDLGKDSWPAAFLRKKVCDELAAAQKHVLWQAGFGRAENTEGAPIERFLEQRGFRASSDLCAQVTFVHYVCVPHLSAVPLEAALHMILSGKLHAALSYITDRACAARGVQDAAQLALLGVSSGSKSE